MHTLSPAARLRLLRRIAWWLNDERDTCHERHPDLAAVHERDRILAAAAALQDHGVPMSAATLDSYATDLQRANQLADGSLDIATYLGDEPMANRWLVREQEEDRLRRAVAGIERSHGLTV